MDISPADAVNHLSDGTWGAILIVTVFVLSAGLVACAMYVRVLNAKIWELGDKRVEEAESHADESKQVMQNSMEVLGKAEGAIQDLTRKVCIMEATSSQLKEKVDCRLCPARSRGGDVCAG